ncbi:NAD-dependent succinate-semialdehyde dehydrogenase [Candidatus Sororendozoicomonas aggregata]|uniref:NAD-dependent succinate-semialdehyde dehydrogenase n=1 Tax=Candidatus Sororendozoicomonas aggregata TaxID=3073239 RepID=UPI002ED5A538
MQSIKNKRLIRTGSFIAGHWHNSDAALNVYNPATGQLLATVSNAGTEQAIVAVDKAYAAQKLWATRTAGERSELLMAWHDAILQNIDDLARILTLEQGKPLAQAKGEVAYGASYVKWFAEEALRVYGDTIPAPSGDKRIVVLKQPVGVVGAITPWNFPNAMMVRKAAAAMAAGCTFVVKPSEETPLSALAVAALAQQAGIPDGVLSVVVSEDAQGIGEVLTTHPHISKFSFTGSTGVGKKLLAQCANGVKRTSMELGGNAPFIVMEDADQAAALSGLMSAKFRNAGQTCVCPNRVFIHRSIYDNFADKLQNKLGTLTIGPGLNDEVDIGPLINEKATSKIKALVERSLAMGAKVLYTLSAPLDGCYYPPTIMVNVNNQMPIARTEIFGPVATLIPFDSEQEVVELANDTEYGLAAYLYTRDVGRIFRMSEALAFGMVAINEGVVSNAASPFGGVKASGHGREGSKYGLDDYLNIKSLCLGGIDA